MDWVASFVLMVGAVVVGTHLKEIGHALVAIVRAICAFLDEPPNVLAAARVLLAGTTISIQGLLLFAPPLQPGVYAVLFASGLVPVNLLISRACRDWIEHKWYTTLATHRSYACADCSKESANSTIRLANMKQEVVAAYQAKDNLAAELKNTQGEVRILRAILAEYQAGSSPNTPLGYDEWQRTRYLDNTLTQKTSQ